MNIIPLLASDPVTPFRNLEPLPIPAGPTVPLADRVALDVLTNSTSTDVIRGANLVFPPASKRATPLPNPQDWGYWGHAFWETWPFETWIMPTMDHMAAAGVNVVAFKGGSNVFARGYISWREYLARWADTLNYAKSLGMRCFVCFGDGRPNVWPVTVSSTTWVSKISDWAEVCAASENVIGVDVINEVWIDSHSDATLAMYIDAVKAFGLPATYDFEMSTSNLTNTFGPLVRARMDFLDFHRYTDVTNTSVSSWRANNPSLPNVSTLRAIFGEFGIQASATNTNITNRYTGMKNLIEADATVAGTTAFAWNDFVDPANPVWPDEASIPLWGMHSVGAGRVLTPRTLQKDIWSTWITNR